MALRKEIKHINIRKEEVNLSLFADMIVYMGGNAFFQILELTSEFSKVVGYKVHVQKTICISI